MRNLLSAILVGVILEGLAIITLAQTVVQPNAGKAFYNTDEVKAMCGVPADTNDMKNVLARQDSSYKDYLHQRASQGLRKTETIPNWKSLMSYVEDQGSCGDCWVHAATGVAEGQLHILIGSNIEIDLNELEISGACNGGWPSSAEGTIQSSKIGSEVGSYPNYQGAKWSIASHSSISGITSIKAALANGPVTACFYVYDDFAAFFYNYPTGVYHYDGHSSYDGAHAIVIVSYDDNSNYWLCKNSWGSSWGDSGYFRIGYGECGMESLENTYITVNQSCEAKLVPNLMSLATALSYSFVSGEYAYVLSNISVGSNASVPSNGMLVINSGLTVSFTGNYKIHVEGALNAQGVTFTRSGGQWYGIEMYGVYGGANYISGCTIENATYGVYDYASYGYRIENSTIQNNGTGIESISGSHVIAGNYLTGNTYGVSCSDYSSLDFEINNWIKFNSRGVYIDATSTPYLGSYWSPVYCSIWGNDWDIWSDYGGTVSAEWNYWGDYPANPMIYGTVDYSNALTAEPSRYKIAAHETARPPAATLNSSNGQAPDTTGMALLTQAIKVERSSTVGQAQTALGSVISTYPTRPVAMIGLAHLSQLSEKSKANTIDMLSGVATTYKATTLVDFAHVLMGQIMIRNNQTDEALAIFEGLAASGGLFEKEALYNAGSLLWYRKNAQAEGERYFRQLIQKYPDDPFTYSALATLGESPTTKQVIQGKPTPPETPLVNDLSSAYPNPFNPAAQISYSLAGPSRVSLVIYDILGREIVTLANGYQQAGRYTVTWNSTQKSGIPVSSGVYFARLGVTNDLGMVTFQKTTRLLLMK